MFLAFVFVEIFLAETNTLRCDFHVFVALDVFDTAFEGHFYDWCERERFVSSRCSHVGELFIFDGVHYEIGSTVVLADDHARVEFCSWCDEEWSTFLEFPERVSHCGSHFS